MSTTRPVRPILRRRHAAALRSRAVSGDATAFTQLYERHHQELYRYCRSIVRHDQDAQDVLQATMTKAFTALQEESRDFELRPWLFRIAHNEAISLLRRRGRTQADSLEEAVTLGDEGLTRTVEQRERLATLSTDLQSLPERQRSALVLRELSGLSHEEIATVIGSSPGGVRQTIFEARRALHECEEGRAMDCAEIQRAISDADGRVLRGRRMRAHLRSCRSCRDFATALERRPRELAALVPALPAAMGASMLAKLLAGGTHGTGTAGGTGLGAGVTATLSTKVLAVVAATAVVAGGGATAVRVVSSAPSHRAADAVTATSTAHAAARSSQAPVSSSAAPASAARTSTARSRPTTRSHTAAARVTSHPAPEPTGATSPDAATDVAARGGAPGAEHRRAAPGSRRPARARPVRKPARHRKSTPQGKRVTAPGRRPVKPAPKTPPAVKPAAPARPSTPAAPTAATTSPPAATQAPAPAPAPAPAQAPAAPAGAPSGAAAPSAPRTGAAAPKIP